jgi:S1-C subfamily serine protease
VRPDDAASTRVGLRTQPVPPVLRAQLRLEGDLDGLVVEEVAAKGIAAEAGLAQWDLILAIDGKAARGEPDLEALLAPGPHRIAIVRGGERKELAVTTPSTPPAPEAKAAPTAPREEPPPSPAPPPKKDELRKY